MTRPPVGRPAHPPPGDPPPLPHTWRPLGVRVVGIIAGLGLLAVALGCWYAFGPDVRARFTFLQRLTLVALIVLVGACITALVRPRVEAREDVVVVVNGFRRRELDWPELLTVRLRRGAPWAEVDLSDGTTVPLMALQGSDGERAVAGCRELQALIEAHAGREPGPR